MNTYQFLVNRIPAIQKEYWRRRKLHKKPAQRAGDWLALLGMNLAWGVGYRSWAADELHPDARRILPKEPESCLHRKELPEEFAKKLRKMGYREVRIIDTAQEAFGSHRRATLMMLGNSRMIVGQK